MLYKRPTYCHKVTEIQIMFYGSLHLLLFVLPCAIVLSPSSFITGLLPVVLTCSVFHSDQFVYIHLLVSIHHCEVFLVLNLLMLLFSINFDSDSGQCFYIIYLLFMFNHTITIACFHDRLQLQPNPNWGKVAGENKQTNK